MRRVEVREEFCIGCRLCEIHCTVQHSRSRNLIYAFKREKPPPPRVRVEERGALSFAVLCRACEEPLCLYSCLTGALERDPVTGIIRVNEEKCIGCWTCVMACPCGAIFPDETRGKAVKCDLCPDLEVPACVAHCPNEALVLV